MQSNYSATHNQSLLNTIFSSLISLVKLGFDADELRKIIAPYIANAKGINPIAHLNQVYSQEILHMVMAKLSDQSGSSMQEAVTHFIRLRLLFLGIETKQEYTCKDVFNVTRVLQSDVKYPATINTEVIRHHAVSSIKAIIGEPTQHFITAVGTSDKVPDLKENFPELPNKTPIQAAYVYCNGKIYYVNKVRNACHALDFTPLQVLTIIDELKMEKEFRLVSEHELKTMKEHPQFKLLTAFDVPGGLTLIQTELKKIAQGAASPSAPTMKQLIETLTNQYQQQLQKEQAQNNDLQKQQAILQKQAAADKKEIQTLEAKVNAQETELGHKRKKLEQDHTAEQMLSTDAADSSSVRNPVIQAALETDNSSVLLRAAEILSQQSELISKQPAPPGGLNSVLMKPSEPMLKPPVSKPSVPKPSSQQANLNETQSQVLGEVISDCVFTLVAANLGSELTPMITQNNQPYLTPFGNEGIDMNGYWRHVYPRLSLEHAKLLVLLRRLYMGVEGFTHEYTDPETGSSYILETPAPRGKLPLNLNQYGDPSLTIEQVKHEIRFLFQHWLTMASAFLSANIQSLKNNEMFARLKVQFEQQHFALYREGVLYQAAITQVKEKLANYKTKKIALTQDVLQLAKDATELNLLQAAFDHLKKNGAAYDYKPLLFVGDSTVRVERSVLPHSKPLTERLQKFMQNCMEILYSPSTSTNDNKLKQSAKQELLKLYTSAEANHFQEFFFKTQSIWTT